MSDDKNKGGDKQDYTPPASQEELNRIITSRVEREREKFADYEDLKQKAAELDRLNESKKTDEQKTNDRITGLEEKLAAAQNDATRARIQAKYSICDADADLFLTATDTEKLEAQAKALADRVADRKKNGPHVPAQKGKTGEAGSDPMRELANQIFDIES